MPMKLILFLILSISLTLSTLAVFDGGYYRHNRLEKSDVIRALKHFSLISISSDHFLRRNTSYQTLSSSNSDGSIHPWMDLKASQDNISILSNDSRSSSVHPSSSFMHSFNTLLSQDTWGGWSPSHAYSPRDAIQHNAVDVMDWDHPTTSSLTFVLGNDEITLDLERNQNLFGPAYRAEVQAYDDAGTMVNRRYVTDQPTTCFYRATVSKIRSYAAKSSPAVQSQGSDGTSASSTIQPTALHIHPDALVTTTSRSGTFQPAGDGEATASKNISLFLPMSTLTESPSEDEFVTTSASITSPLNAIDSCRGGFTGSFLYKGKTYHIMPAVNHLPAQDIVTVMAEIEGMSTLNTRDITASSLHIIIDSEEDMIHPLVQAQQQSRQNLRRYLKQTGQQEEDHSHSGDDHDVSDDSQDHTHHDDPSGHDHASYCGHNHSPQGEDALDTILLQDAQQIEQLIKDATAQSVFQPTASSDGEFQPQQQVFTQFYLEWMLVTDSRRLANLGENQALLNAASLANYVFTYYNYHNTNAPTFSTPIEVVLITQVLLEVDPWESRVQIGASSGQCEPAPHEVCSNVLLSEFQSFRVQLQGTYEIDNMHLLSGHDFDLSTLGLATVGQMCNSYASAVNQVQGANNTPFYAIVLAHELGHNFGAYHDAQVGISESCPTGVNIMSPSLNSNVVETSNTRFSPCSISMINQFISRPAVATCLANRPTHRWGDPVCGNGFLEAGETCDCGQVDCSQIDPCCNGALCQLYSQTMVNGDLVDVQCSSMEPCCSEQCQFLSADIECRSPLTSCDLPEYCTGTAGSCPIDVGKGSGHECDIDGDPGHCFLGVCTNEHRTCYNLGLQQGIENMHACPYADKTDPDYCSILQCQRPGESTCIRFSSNGIPLMMDNGVSCGPANQRHQCYQGNCVSMNEYEPNFRWTYNEWEPCSACGETQVRSATCVDVATHQVQSDASVCVAPDSVYYSLVRPCNNVELGCVYSQSAEERGHPGKLYFFGVWLPRLTVALIFVGIALFYIALALICYRFVTSPVKGKKDMST